MNIFKRELVLKIARARAVADECVNCKVFDSVNKNKNFQLENHFAGDL